MNRIVLQFREVMRERISGNGGTHLRDLFSPITFFLLLLASGVVLGMLFGKLPWFVSLGFAAAVSLGAALYRFPFLGIVLIAFFLPFERIGALETDAGTIRLTQLLLAALLVAFFIVWMRRGIRLQPSPLLLPLCLFLAANVLGLLFAPNQSYSTEILALTAFTMTASILVPQLVTSEQRLTTIVRVVLLSALLVSAFGVFQFFGDLLGLPTTVTGLRELYTKDVFGFPRVQSTALEPLYFANYLLLPISVAYALFLHRWKRLPAWLLFALLVLFGGNLLLTVSRGGYAGMAMSLTAITLLSLRQFVRIRVLVPVIIGAVLVLVGLQKFLNFGDLARLNIETFTQHIVEVFSGPSFQERVETIEQARSAFWQSPWVGIGPGSFGPFVAAHPLVKPDGGWRIVNNEPLELLAETGVLGFLSIVAMALVLLIRSFRAGKRSGYHSSFIRAAHIGLLGAFLGMLVQYQTFSVLYIMHVWFLVGLLIATQSLLLRRQQEGSL